MLQVLAGYRDCLRVGSDFASSAGIPLPQIPIAGVTASGA